MTEKTEGMLSPYRVLDLTDEKGLICGKILGDMGADVIKIEKPGGDATRNTGPFYHDDPDPEKSLFWFALNTSKRGITLNIETAEGQEIFKSLAKTADFVIESFPPGYLDKLGLGYSDLEKINPRVILVSITPFGQTGPYKDWKTSDIVAWALGGDMAPYGDPDRPPLRISHHSQAYLHAGSDGAMGALTALYQRWSTGEGQQVDVSIQEAAVHSSIHHNPTWNSERPPGKRGEGMPGAGHDSIRLWPCKDGYVSWSHGGASRLGPSRPLIRWMDSEGWADDFLREYDWERPDFTRIPQDEMDRLEEPTARFFMSHTKAELLEGAVKYEVMLYPVATTADMLENPQLVNRGFWVDVEHPELDDTITYPGAFAGLTELPLRISRRAPLIGEHNQEIYEQELDIAKEKLFILKQDGVI
ncbi:MAG: CoA transferase [Dehalococcoidales bacterium]|jgi:crotonobetainyl-CoA:carnitine CoA-transferase CaiB-like acyl-CoA transferase|nr:CoA transferase [Dehalococcoidales bacterium]MDP7525703.1 CoA transferase [Dehalococcoidales bacterium]